MILFFRFSPFFRVSSIYFFVSLFCFAVVVVFFFFSFLLLFVGFHLAQSHSTLFFRFSLDFGYTRALFFSRRLLCPWTANAIIHHQSSCTQSDCRIHANTSVEWQRRIDDEVIAGSSFLSTFLSFSPTFWLVFSSFWMRLAIFVVVQCHCVVSPWESHNIRGSWASWTNKKNMCD